MATLQRGGLTIFDDLTLSSQVCLVFITMIKGKEDRNPITFKERDRDLTL